MRKPNHEQRAQELGPGGIRWGGGAVGRERPGGLGPNPRPQGIPFAVWTRSDLKAARTSKPAKLIKRSKKNSKQ